MLRQSNSHELTDGPRSNKINQVDVKLSEQSMPDLNAKLQECHREGPAQDMQTFCVEHKADHMVLMFADGMALGILRDNIFKSFSPILQRERALHLEAVAVTRVICDRIGKINKASDRIVKVDINVYGARRDAQRIGEDLSAKKLWLQRPDKARFPYENPHVISFPGMEHVSASMNDVQAGGGAANSNPRTEEERVQQMVSEVHDSLQRANELETTSGDRRLKPQLLECVFPVPCVPRCASRALLM